MVIERCNFFLIWYLTVFKVSHGKKHHPEYYFFRDSCNEYHKSDHPVYGLHTLYKSNVFLSKPWNYSLRTKPDVNNPSAHILSWLSKTVREKQKAKFIVEETVSIYNSMQYQQKQLAIAFSDGKEIYIIPVLKIKYIFCQWTCIAKVFRICYACWLKSWFIHKFFDKRGENFVH